MFKSNKEREYASLSIESLGKTVSLPILQASEGPDVIDVSKLYAETGFFTYDPGFMSTASCKSSLTYIDGENGVLKHEGHMIDKLADNYEFMDICYLLINGNLPKEEKRKVFIKKINKHNNLPDEVIRIIKSFDRNSHPMAIMMAATSGLAAYFHSSININDEKNRNDIVISIIAKIPVIAAIIYRHLHNKKIIEPDKKLGYVENFLKMMFADSNGKYQVNNIHSKAIEKLFILHADHEQNASTSTARLVGSTGANPFAVISASIAALWGPAHGGANEAVLNMLNQIGDIKNIDEFIEKAKDKDDPFRLMGFGHRVYKNYDPRAVVIKKACHEILSDLHIENDQLLQIAVELEKIALHDNYFIERKLYPNVDFYSGIIYRALGISTDMFTVMFAVARTTGWIAQWKEMVEDPALKIGRPRQLYVGKVKA